MFHSFLSNDIKQYSTSTATHRKHITELLKKRQHFFYDFSTMWYNKDGCNYQ